jgi:hypothetical protein
MALIEIFSHISDSLASLYCDCALSIICSLADACYDDSGQQPQCSLRACHEPALLG